MWSTEKELLKVTLIPRGVRTARSNSSFGIRSVLPTSGSMMSHLRKLDPTGGMHVKFASDPSGDSDKGGSTRPVT